MKRRSPRNYVMNSKIPKHCIEGQQITWEELPNPDNVDTSPIVVGVIDNGFDPTFSNISDNLWTFPNDLTCYSSTNINGYNAINPYSSIQDRKHATGVAAIIGSLSPSQADLQLMNIKAKQSGSQNKNLFRFICGMQFGLDAGVDIFNISMGYYGRRSALLKRMIDTADSLDVLIVASAGNGGETMSNHWPSSFTGTYQNVVSVGATNAEGEAMSFSSQGDIYVPGYNIFFKNNSTEVKFVRSGTSFSTPAVTAAAVAILASDASITPNSIKNEIIDANIGLSWPDTLYKYIKVVLEDDRVDIEDDILVETQDITTEDEEFSAYNSITSTATIDATSTITFRAGEQIILSPGFNTLRGSHFKATISECISPPPSQNQREAYQKSHLYYLRKQIFLSKYIQIHLPIKPNYSLS